MFHFSKLTIHDDIAQEDEILNEIESKLTFTDNLDYIDDVTMEDYEPSFKDEDISMQDCTDTDYKRTPQGKVIFANNNLRNSNGKREVVEEAANQRGYTENDNTETIPKMIPSDTTSLVSVLLQPETQGYKLGILRAEKKASCNDNEQRHNMKEDASFNEDTNFTSKGPKKNGSELVLRKDFNFTGKHGIQEPGNTIEHSEDTTTNGIIIHNHFYNNIFNPSLSVSERNGLSYNDNNDATFDYNDSNSDVAKIAQPNTTLVRLEYIKKSINYSIVVCFLFLLLRNISDDARKEYERAVMIEELKIEQCHKEYIINRCDEYGQLPALKEQCLEWLSCFSERPISGVFYTEIFINLIGRLINGFLGSLSHMSKVFLLVVLIVWYIGNFITGYIKGRDDFTTVSSTDVSIQKLHPKKVK